VSSEERVDVAAARMMRGRGIGDEEIARALVRSVSWVKRALGDAQRRDGRRQLWS
jgi:hypothetical protein